VTIDPDTESLLRAEIQRTGLSFKQVLNESIRRSLMAKIKPMQPIQVVPLFSAPFPTEFSGISFNHLVDELDDETTHRELGA